MKFTIPHYCTFKRKPRRIMVNLVLSMNPMSYNRIHNKWTNELTEYFENNNIILPKLEKDQQLEVKLTFYRDKSTRVLDLDGFSILLKWSLDFIKDRINLPDDNFRYVPKMVIEYSGMKDSEEVIIDLTYLTPSETS